MEGKILTEFILKLDQFKSENKREATKVLGFLGDVGGFAAAVEGVFSLIGSYFSSKYLAASIASNLYVERKPKNKRKSSH